MPQSDLSEGREDSTVERVAARLGAADVADVAAAAYEAAGALAARRCGRTAAAVAALSVAARRSAGREIDPSNACERLDLDPAAVEHATRVIDRELGPTAPAAEIRSLRQSIVAIDELLASIERGRVNPPRLSGAAFDEIDPCVAAVASRPLDEVDPTRLRALRRRFREDLEMARLGVKLYALVGDRRGRTGEDASSELD